MRVEWLKEFQLRVYGRFSIGLFGSLVLVFAVLTTMQSMVSYPGAMQIVDTGGFWQGEVAGCSTSPQGNPLGTTCGYFLHNMSVALVAWIGGFAVVGPFYVLWENGANIGTYIGRAITDPVSLERSWDTTPALLAFLVPHGIFEIPGIVLSLALGFYIADIVVDTLRNDTSFSEFSVTNVLRETAPWMVLVIGLLAMAAVIEANISPLVASGIEGMF